MIGFGEVFYYEPWWIQIVKGIVVFALGLQLVPLVLLVERKLLGRFQSRYGPNRVGPFGILQPLADIGKLLGKEQFRPAGAGGAQQARGLRVVPGAAALGPAADQELELLAVDPHL